MLTLHCPDTPENYGLISAERIRAMKRGAYFSNLARAALVDDEALYAALRDGHLAGAALDVFADEPVRPENRYVQLPNVLVSPHLGGATRDVVRHQTRPDRRRDRSVAARRAAALHRQSRRARK